MIFEMIPREQKEERFRTNLQQSRIIDNRNVQTCNRWDAYWNLSACWEAKQLFEERKLLYQYTPELWI